MTNKVRAYIGADPGLSGAIALFAPGRRDFKPGDTDITLLVLDMPTVTVGGKRGIDMNHLAEILVGWGRDLNCHATVERVHAMPGQGVTSMFSFGFAAGSLQQALASARIPVTLISPVTWKASYKLQGGRENKGASAVKAVELFPKIKDQLYGPKGGVKDGRAEAVLLAHYGSKLQ